MGLEYIMGYKCKRCGYEWKPKNPPDKVPKVCPSCHSAYWDREKRKM